MNIYEKLQLCKSELQSKGLKKTGQNSFAHYDYWELSDFLPSIISLFKDNNLCSFFSFGTDLATLTIVNSEMPEEIINMTSPMSTADLKGCHAIQNMGAVQTYQRRYLYMAAFDISEPDVLDGTLDPQKSQQGKQQAKVPFNEPDLPPIVPISASKARRVYQLAAEVGVSEKTLLANVKANAKVDTVEAMTEIPYEKIMAWLTSKKKV